MGFLASMAVIGVGILIYAVAVKVIDKRYK